MPCVFGPWRALMGVLCLVGVLVSFSGCAKFPPGGGAGPSRRLHFVIELAAPVNPNYVYIV
ncbi:MAG: hypothetical protein K6T17_03135, partial [Fimbriimonadales bacterium]|nr:hypothetical protein [Fimbriimonadales bacterium]